MIPTVHEHLVLSPELLVLAPSARGVSGGGRGGRRERMQLVQVLLVHRIGLLVIHH